MYAGSYSMEWSASGISILGKIAAIIVILCSWGLPIYMARKFNCKNKGLIIASVFIPLVGWVLSFFLIARSKKESKYYEDNGKKVAWLHIVMYALSILALFTSLARLRNMDDIEIDQITNFSLISYLIGNPIKYTLSYETNNIIITAGWIFIAASIIGLIVNLIFRDARKPLILMANSIIQNLNVVIIYLYVSAFDNWIWEPGTALLLESLISIVFAVSIYITVGKTSYIDN